MAEELRLASNVQRSLMPRAPAARPARGGARVHPLPRDRRRLLRLRPPRPPPHGLRHRRRDGQGRAGRAAGRQPQGLDPRPGGGRRPLPRRAGRQREPDVLGRGAQRPLRQPLLRACSTWRASRLDYVNAGHHYPFLVQPDGAVRDLVGGRHRARPGRGLAATSRARCRSEPGDLFVFYSDGVTDRTNAAGRAVRRRAAEGGGGAEPAATPPASRSTRCWARSRAGRAGARPKTT